MNEINELVDMLDRLVSDGSGHINVTAAECAEELSVTSGQGVCCGIQPCMAPTLHKDIDDDEEK